MYIISLYYQPSEVQSPRHQDSVIDRYVDFPSGVETNAKFAAQLADLSYTYVNKSKCRSPLGFVSCRIMCSCLICHARKLRPVRARVPESGSPTWYKASEKQGDKTIKPHRSITPMAWLLGGESPCFSRQRLQKPERTGAVGRMGTWPALACEGDKGGIDNKHGSKGRVFREDNHLVPLMRSRAEPD